VSFVRLHGVNHHYEIAGDGPGPAVVFVNSLGTDFRIWRGVAEVVACDRQVLLYDKRGHGLSAVGGTPYSMEMLAEDLAALMDHVGLRDAVICGVSIGGMIAQRLLAERPDLIRSLVLCDTLARFGDPAMWSDRITRIEAGGLAAIADGVMQRWFSPGFFARCSDEVDGYRTMFLRQPADGYIATCIALRDADLTALLHRITVPTICVGGADDGSSPPDKVAALAAAIPGARFELIPDCGHIPSIEQPATLVRILASFLSRSASESAPHVSH
jgi:3-oxoadipate enol-lactonase